MKLKEQVIVYGIGNFFEQVIKQLQEKYDIVAYSDQNCGEKIENNIVVSLEEALEKQFDKIVITILNVQMCYEVIRTLIHKYGITSKKIVLGSILLYENGERNYYLNVNEKGDIVFSQNELSIAARNIDEFNNIFEIYQQSCYSYFLTEKEEVVLDIGMNIGGAALFFASKKQIKQIYGYEPFLGTYTQALYNIRNNCMYQKKIECFQYGISNRNDSKEIMYNQQMSCGQSTVEEGNCQARKNYKEWNLISEKDDILERINIRDIKEVLTEVYEEHRDKNIILKIDCEGEEYNILNRMAECNLLGWISMIMMEWHYGRKEKLLNILKSNGFAFWEFDKTDNTGLVYAINLKSNL